ncbi:MAG: aldo/keto reductase [Gammaproteobacteria bacterium]|nr:aldo/keto reductase [Gammaproteobacteria bacterium]
MQRRLGRNGPLVSAVGLGLADFAAGPGRIARTLFAPLDQTAKTEVIKAALDGGINWFDTAEMYGFGVSERSLAAALRSLDIAPASVMIANKWFPLFRTARSIAATIDARLSALNGYPIGLYMVHHPYGFSSAASEMKAMAALAKKSLISAVGVSNFSARAMRQAHQTLADLGLPLVANELRFNLLHRGLETNGVLETARELGISLIAYSPLAKGFLSGRFHRDPKALATQGLRRRLMMPQDLTQTAPLMEALSHIAEAHGVNAAEVALAWVLHRLGDSGLAVIGATKPWQASAAASAMALALSDDEMGLLTERSDHALK